MTQARLVSRRSSQDTVVAGEVAGEGAGEYIMEWERGEVAGEGAGEYIMEWERGERPPARNSLVMCWPDTVRGTQSGSTPEVNIVKTAEISLILLHYICLDKIPWFYALIALNF